MNISLAATLKRNRFWVALVLVIVLGYQLGKDRALTLNAAERSAAAAAR